MIVTEPFIPTARAMAEMAGMPDYPFVVVDHPIGSLTPAEVCARADSATAGVTALLTTRR
ncbi:MAG: hypothetical protein V3V67_03775 [Myxococcota bacterium]